MRATEGEAEPSASHSRGARERGAGRSGAEGAGNDLRTGPEPKEEARRVSKHIN